MSVRLAIVIVNFNFNFRAKTDIALSAIRVMSPTLLRTSS